jgi:2-dehydro-3-deoxyphosphooctonate aldolase (KDO 8-P synthase)
MKNPSNNFFLIAGPCAIEGEEMTLRIAEHLVQLTEKLSIPFYFKGSFKKANRSRLDSFTGIGDEKALKILDKVRQNFGIPTLTDIHKESDAEMAAAYVDVLQIPAFLVRQTELIQAAAKTGKIVNLKKGQFMSPESMKHAVKKVKDSGNGAAWITDRGTMFGYQDIVVDFRGIPTMKQIAPTVLDVTHSLQQPNQSIGVTGGQPEMIETIARAGIAAGADGLFIETHFDTKNAKSDGANMLQLDQINGLMHRLVEIRQTVNSF